MNKAINVGNVVKLNSGGPAMTVESVSAAGPHGLVEHAHTVWFDAYGERSQGTFAASSLEVVLRP